MVGEPALRATAGLVVLVLSPSQNAARLIESRMRNAGHALRAAWLTDLEELEDALTRAGASLLLCAPELPRAPLRSVLALQARLSPDLPVLLLVDRSSLACSASALAQGARDCVGTEDEQDLAHLEQVCLRELRAFAQLQELRQLRMQLADFEARHRHLVAGTADAIAHVREGIVEDVNPAFAELLGARSGDELVGQPLMDLIAGSDQARVKAHLRPLLKGSKNEDSLELPLCRRDGSIRPVKAQLSRSQREGETQIQLLIHSEAPARAAPAPQGLTRSALFDALAAQNDTQRPAPAALLAVRVDDLERIEERLGLADADEVFATLKELIAERLDPRDRLFSTAPAEWVIVAAPRPGFSADALAEILRREVSAQLFKTPRFEAHLTATAVAYPLGGDTGGLREVVDEIVFEARRGAAQGGNRAVVLGPTARSEQEFKEGQRQAARIRKAIEDKRLKLAYQSIASLEGDAHQYFDVFVRMIDETGQERLAREFLPAAEKHGLMRLIDRWVTTRCLGLLAKRAAARDHATLFVRLSEDTLKDADGFIAWFQDQMRIRAVQADELVFEIQEGILQNHIRKAKQLSDAMARLRVDIAIDYFGVGNNSAPLLDHVPARYVKFHPSYTREFWLGDRQKRMRELLDAARQRNAKAIVSQVEDANVMARLWQMGVNFLQGNSVQEPEVVLLSADVHVG